MSLQTAYRPISFKQMVGNTDTLSAIRTALADDGHNHCMLFSGPSGTGKTTLARVVARVLGAYDPTSTNNPGFREINAADFRGIDNVRAIRDESARVPLGSDVRVFFMDEAHMLTPQSQEMWLKQLEEAKGFNYYFFATTNPEMFRDTFRRRLAHYKLLPLTDAEIKANLIVVCQKEGIDAPDDVLNTITGDCMGSMGIALGVLDAIRGMSGEQMQKAASSAAAKQNAVIDLCRTIAKAGCTWKQVTPILASLKEQGEDAEGIRRMVLGYCSSWLLKKDEPRAFVIIDAFSEPMYNIGFPGVVRACYIAVNA